MTGNSSTSDGILLITAGYDRTIRFWHAGTAVIYRTIMHEDSVRFNNKVFYKKKTFVLFSLAN